MTELFPSQSFKDFVVQKLYGEERIVTPLSITTATDKLSLSLGRKKETGIIVNGAEIIGVSPQHGVGVVANREIVSIPWKVIRDNPKNFRPIVLTTDTIEVPGYAYSKVQAAMVDFDGTIKDHGKGVSQKVWDTIYDTLRQGKAFAIATGRGQPSIEKFILEPFRAYLRDKEPVDERLFVIAGNNGAIFNTGISSINNVYKIPLFETEDRVTEFMKVLSSNKTPLFTKLMEYYLAKHDVDPKVAIAQRSDNYSFYFNAGDNFDKAREEAGVGHLSLVELGDLINKELAAAGLALKVEVNTGGLDLVNRNAGKHIALARFRRYIYEITNNWLHTTEIVTIGDNPEGNDRRLVTREMGVSDITRQGAHAVASYLDIMLNN